MGPLLAGSSIGSPFWWLSLAAFIAGNGRRQANPVDLAVALAWGAFLGPSVAFAVEAKGGGGLALGLFLFGLVSSAVGLVARRALRGVMFGRLYPAFIGAAFVLGTVAGVLGAGPLRNISSA